MSNRRVTFRGRCRCGQVTYTAQTPIKAIVRCHCTICRELHKMPYTAFVESLVDYSDIQGEMYSIESSERAERLACVICDTIVAMYYYGSDKIWFTVGTITTPLREVPCYDIYTDTSVEAIESLPEEYTSFPREILVV